MRGLIFSLTFALSASAQTGPATATAWFSSSGPISTNSGPPVPYSAEQTTEQVQTLADGTHITHGIQKTLFYRDSAGRTRTEHIFAPPPGAPPTVTMPTMIQIMDPVAGYMYHLNSQNHTAQRMAWPPARLQASGKNSGAITVRSGTIAAMVPALAPAISTGAVAVQVPPAAADSSNPLRPQIQRESLGADTMEGLAVTGTRVTTTYSEGSVGNDRPITVITENWVSQELKMPVLSKTSDPRSGETTTKLTSVSLSEPDPSLFQVPADYTISDQQQQQ